MESLPEKPTMIHFKNQPRFSEHEVDQKFNERRLMLVPHIEHFLTTDELFKDKEVEVEFSHKGVSSLLSFITVEREKYILKVPLSAGQEGEAMFLQKWESVGVKVPHVFREGEIADHPYILMEYIDAPLLMDAIKDGTAKKNVSFDLGKILAQMHTPEAQGYGRVVNGKPEYRTFKDWLLSGDLKKRFEYIKENSLIADTNNISEKVIDTLIAYTEKDKGTTYCHLDFGANNVMATEPLTVIDPNPRFNNGIVDVGMSVLLEISGGYAGEHFKEGYFSGDKVYDPKALEAAIALNAYWKFPYWHKKNKTEQIENVRRYLGQI